VAPHEVLHKWGSQANKPSLKPPAPPVKQVENGGPDNVNKDLYYEKDFGAAKEGWKTATY